MENELKQSLKKIFDKYKNTVKSKISSKQGFEKIAIRTNLTSQYFNKLANELIENANKYIEDHNIKNKLEIENLIKQYLSDFTTYCLAGK
jgi:hypothetical protein